MAQHDKPKTNWKEVPGTRFVNPYNFVPLEENCKRSAVGARPGSLTGYLDCCLKPLTPVFIPNTTNDKALHTPRDPSEDTHTHGYDFFSYSDLRGKSAKDIIGNPSLPVIPGSEIRGAIRSVFEAAFNGCMSSVHLERPLGRRSGTPKEAGILRKDREKDQWEITPCRRCMLNTAFSSKEEAERFGQYVDTATYEKWEEGQLLYVRSRHNYIKKRNDGKRIDLGIPIVEQWKETAQTGPEWKPSYLHKGEKFGMRKHHEAVFVEKENLPRISVEKADVDRLREVLHQYRDIKVNIHARQTQKKTWYEAYEIKEEGTLVYYNDRTAGMPLYMAPACISKEVFGQSIENLLHQQGGYQPCERRDHVCPACALFGMIPKGAAQGEEAAGGARASRVRFEDAALLKQPGAEQIGRCYLPKLTLPEMGEPKPGAVEFYTLPPSGKQQGGDSYGYWTYDYCQMKGSSRRPLPKDRPKLRGRKFYWHSDAWKKHEHNREEPTEMRHMIRPLKQAAGTGEDEDMLFGFRVYFENITEKELNQLRWALTFNDVNCAHKIGRAKPLGFGSVQLRVEQIYLRQINRESGEWSLEPWKLEEYSIESTGAIVALKAMVNWEQRPEAEVCYPKGQADSQSVGGKNASASHQWFTANRGTINKPAFAKVLPKPEEEMARKDPEGRWLYELKKT